MTIVLERCGDAFEDASALDEHVLVRVHQNVADRAVAQERFERAEAEDFIDDFAVQQLALAEAERRRLLGKQLSEERPNLALGARPFGVRESLEIQTVQQLAVDISLELHVLSARSLRTRCDGRWKSDCDSWCHGWLPDGSDFVETEKAAPYGRRR